MSRTLSGNLGAFCDTISHSEGTFGKGDDGYNVLVGGTLFTEYADHPRQHVYIASINTYSTAAGRYQILERTFDAYKEKLGLADFSPASQDAIAAQMIKETGASIRLYNGDFSGAIKDCAHLWASLPGAGYGQHENELDSLAADYKASGGVA